MWLRLQGEKFSVEQYGGPEFRGDAGGTVYQYVS